MWPTIQQVDVEQFWRGYQLMIAEAVCMGMLVAWSLRAFATFVWEALKELVESARRKR